MYDLVGNRWAMSVHVCVRESLQTPLLEADKDS